MLADNGIAVCIFDADVARDKPSEMKKLQNMRKKYAERDDVVICDSMPSIEYWFLIHYLNTNKHFSSSEDVIRVLRKYMPDFSKHESFLSKEKWVGEMVSDGKLDDALNRAKNFGTSGESYSNVDKAFDKFQE